MTNWKEAYYRAYLFKIYRDCIYEMSPTTKNDILEYIVKLT